MQKAISQHTPSVMTPQVKALVLMALKNPEAAVRQIKADEAVEQDLRALRHFPEALMSLFRADNAPITMKSSIEVILEEVGYQIMT